jgi:hypothetical protein
LSFRLIARQNFLQYVLQYFLQYVLQYCLQTLLIFICIATKSCLGYSAAYVRVIKSVNL